MHELIMIGIGLVLTVGTGFFVASEFALVNLDRNELEARQARGEKRLGPTISALKITSTHLSSAQLGITLTTLLTGYTFEPAISSLLREPMLSLGIPEQIVPGIGAVIGILIATVFSMIIGELVPKNFALAVPLATAKFVIPFQALFTAVFRPIIILFNSTANRIIRSFGIEPKEELSGARSAEELGFLVRRSALEGLLDPEHATLLNRTLRFADHDAVDVMTPRVRISTVHGSDSAEQIVALATATGFSRFPVIGRDSDDIVGVVHVKQAFAVALPERETVLASALMTPPLRVPESMGVDSLLGVLRKRGFQIAIVSDEHGGTAGIVTLEDLVEELVGELEDEHDRSRVGVVRTGRSTTFVASLRPDELLERTGVRVPDGEEYDTIAGFVADELNRTPELGDEVEVNGGFLRVERVDGNRVERLKFTPNDSDAVSDTVSGAASDLVSLPNTKATVHE
jgi:CBS domain containing-hemolysin-like protein